MEKNNESLDELIGIMKGEIEGIENDSGIGVIGNIEEKESSAFREFINKMYSNLPSFIDNIYGTFFIDEYVELEIKRSILEENDIAFYGAHFKIEVYKKRDNRASYAILSKEEVDEVQDEEMKKIFERLKTRIRKKK